MYKQVVIRLIDQTIFLNNTMKNKLLLEIFHVVL